VSHRKLHWRRRERWGKTWDDEVTPTPSKSSAHSKRRLSTHRRHLPIAFPSRNRALSRHSDPFSMMPLRKPSRSEGFLTETRQVFPHLVQWSFLWDTHQQWPKNFRVFESVSYLVFIVLCMTLVLIFKSEVWLHSYGESPKSGGLLATPKIGHTFPTPIKHCISASRALFDFIQRLLWLSIVPGQYIDTSYLSRTHFFIKLWCIFEKWPVSRQSKHKYTATTEHLPAKILSPMICH
jgi:hypothetical protein